MSRTLAERFDRKVDRSGDCWEWTGSKTKAGYGTIHNPSGSRLAHRVSYEIHNGKIPEGLIIDHMCRNVSCVNPAHLRQVTPMENLQNLSTESRTAASGLRGSYWDKSHRKWRAGVVHNGKHVWAGLHPTRELAAEAARELRLSLQTHNDADRSAA